ncbi:kinase-like domain-containing protein [Mycena olivaceomarginata]|nr:kinase-like domain-containing protein [Mycena olivaceomarginata]
MTSKVSVVCQKQDLFLSAPKFAVVGASANPAENGYKALKFLLEKSKDVVPINPSASEIQGINCLKTLSELPDPTHTSVFIVAPPNVTFEVLKLAKALNIFALWLQPGAEDDAVVKFIQADPQLEGRCLYREDREDGLYRGTIPPEHALARFALVPELIPTGDIICGIFQRCESVTQSRNAAFQLRDRCLRLGLVLYANALAHEDVSAGTESVILCLQQISAKMRGWLPLTRVQGLLRQAEIMKEIENCHRMLTNCWGSVQTETDTWEARFTLETEKDHCELVAYLVDIENSQQIINDAFKSEKIQQMMSMMQQLMASDIHPSNQQHNGLSSNLYDLQLKSRELLPDFNLRSGEVIRIGQFPVSGTATMDIYEGLYLGREKVAIKVVRAVNANEHSLRRFNRECDIWKKLWKIDQGQHVLPFYGFCQEDGPFPYIVSPWQPNGTALTYVKREGDKVDYLKLVKGVALGLQVLHSMVPHVVHGDIKASNIVIDSGGNPLIADFGLSRIVEDITGIPFSQSRGVSDSYRWFAPEVCIGEGVLSLRSDVYAYGMTVLEIFTHEQPYNNIKHTTEVVIRSAKGEKPLRPTEDKVIQRGLDDDMSWSVSPLRAQRWALMTKVSRVS